MAATIAILDGTGDSAADGTNTFQGDVSATPGTILATDNTPTSVFESELEGIPATTNISIAATTLITINDLADNNLNLQQTAGNSVTLTAPTFTMVGAPTDTISTAGGALTINASTAATIGGLNTNGGLVTLDMGTTGTVSGVIAGANTALTKAGAGTLTLSGTNTYTGGTNINGGVLSIAADANLGAAPGAATPNYLTFDGGTLQTTQTFALNANRGVTFNAGGGTIETASGTTLTYGGIAAGVGSLTKTGTGDLLLAGANTYTGTTTVSAGTLRISNAAALGATGPASETTVASGATLSVEGGITTAEAITLNGSGVSGAGALTGTGNSTVSGAITLGTGTPTVGVAAGVDTLTLSGAVGGTSLTKVGAGTLSLTNVNNYSGATNVNAGVLSVSGGFAIPDTSAVTVASGALLNLQASETIGSLAGNTPATGGTVQLNANTLTTGGDNSNTAFAGQITGTGGVTKAGTGTFTLTGTNTYLGATTINAGTLLVNGSIAASTTTVNNTGTLGGTNGTVGAINIAAGGALSPGASAGQLTATGAITFSSGAFFNVELGGTDAGTDYDQLVAAGAVTLGDATLTGSLLSAPVIGTAYTIIDKTSGGAVTGTFLGLAEGAATYIGNRAFQISYAGGTGNDVTLSLGTLKVSGSAPVDVLADEGVTTTNTTNGDSPEESVDRIQQFNDDIIATVNAGVTVNGFGLAFTTTKPDGIITATNHGSIVADAAGSGPGLLLTGTGVNFVTTDGTISGTTGIQTVSGTTLVVVAGTVTGTGGTAIVFDPASFSNVVDLKPTAVVNGELNGSGNDDGVRLSGASGSGSFDLNKIGSGFSRLVKSEGSTWTVTGALSDPNVATTIVNGALIVDGTIGGGVTVGTSFTETLPVPAPLLGGSGTVGSVLVQDKGILAPGASAGTLTVTGNLAMTGGSILRIEIGGAGAGQFDVLNLNGTGGIGLIDLGGATLTGSLIGIFTPTLGQSFTIIDNADSDAIASPFNGLSEGAGVSFAGQTFTVSYVGGDGNDVTLTAAANGAPGLTDFGPTVNVTQAGPGAAPQILDSNVTFTDVEGNFNTGTLVVAGLLPEDTVSVLSTGSDIGQFFIDEQGAVDDLYFEGNLIGTIAGGVGSTLTVTLNAAANTRAVDALIENLTLLDTASNPTFGRDLTVTVTDAASASTGPQPIHVNVFNGTIAFGGSGDDSFAPTGNAHIDAGGGIDTITFDFRLVDATVTYSGNQVTIDAPSRHMVLSGFEVFNFTDGSVNNNDGDWLVDDLFYYSQYHDVWTAHAEADTHYHTTGWHEGRDPDAFFSTMIYLSANPDVKAAGGDPLSHFHGAGWQEGRVPSLDFDPRQYLAANPDVKAAGVDPLVHFLQFGAGEGRQPFKPTELVTANGFDFVWYLDHNPDVAAAGVDPFQHFQQFGWHEGRNPNALFDTNGYLANYGDVAAAGVNPLDHYNAFGWHEGRDPSVGFDTTSYLAAYADVNAAHVNPLVHFLQYGIHEGRSPFADGVWG